MINLYEKEKHSGGDKVANMLSQDFTTERWRKAALKNAMVLRQKQRYLLSITFFILGDDVKSAVQIARQGMSDTSLAILICRMMLLLKPDNKEIEEILKDLYKEYFIKRGETLNDPYLVAIGWWN